MLECVDVRRLQLVEQLFGGGGRGDGRANRHGVNQQAHHRFGAGHVAGRPETVVPNMTSLVAGQPDQQLRKRALQHDVERGVA